MNKRTALEILIRERSHEKGLSIAELCRKSGVPASTMYRVFKGANAGNFTIKTLTKIANTLDCNIKILLEPI